MMAVRRPTTTPGASSWIVADGAAGGPDSDQPSLPFRAAWFWQCYGLADRFPDPPMCNLYSQTKSQDAPRGRRAAGNWRSHAGIIPGRCRRRRHGDAGGRRPCTRRWICNVRSRTGYCRSWLKERRCGLNRHLPNPSRCSTPDARDCGSRTARLRAVPSGTASEAAGLDPARTCAGDTAARRPVAGRWRTAPSPAAEG